VGVGDGAGAGAAVVGGVAGVGPASDPPQAASRAMGRKRARRITVSPPLDVYDPA
jgi:hypothetical protein